MAGDWIPRTKGFSRKAEVLAIAAATNLHRRFVADLLMDFWDWADAETADGTLPGLTLAQLPGIVPDTDPAFWSAVASSGWLVATPTGLTIPNFERWMGKSAKRRLSKNARQARWRSPGARRKDAKNVGAAVDNGPSRKAPTTEPNRTEPNKGGDPPLNPRGEKRRRGLSPAVSPSLPPGLDTVDFRAAWEAWIAYRIDRRLTCRADTLQAQLAFLDALGPAGAVASVSEAIRNGWNGLFEPRARSARAPAPASDLSPGTSSAAAGAAAAPNSRSESVDDRIARLDRERRCTNHTGPDRPTPSRPG